MKFGVVTFPGSNCDQDMIHVLGNVMGQSVTNLWHKDHNLKNCDCIVLPGGFSYGDYLRSGAIARFSPIMQEVIAHARQGGLVIGICNGFQVLCESHLLEGALIKNINRKFICDNCFIAPQNSNTLITRALSTGKAYKIPIAHAEGRFYADKDTLKTLNDENRVIFRYSDENGNISETHNPNGSLENIAGICNREGNVFGMMPHPERASEEDLGNTDGRKLFESLLSTIPA